MVGHIGNVKPAIRSKLNFVRFVQLRLEGWAAIPRETSHASAGYGGDNPFLINPADNVAFILTKIQPPVGAAGDAKGIVQLGHGGQSAIAAIAFFPGASDRGQGCCEPPRQRKQRYKAKNEPLGFHRMDPSYPFFSPSESSSFQILRWLNSCHRQLGQPWNSTA